MYSFNSRRIAVLLEIICLMAAAQLSQAAIITEGDAELNSNEIYVAQNFGDGSLTITAPTIINNAGGIFIANQQDFTGSVTIDGGEYNGGGNTFAIGQQGTGSLSIINGGKILSQNGANLVVAEQQGSSGNVLISGAGSLLDTPYGYAYIGQTGIGTFTIENGASANHYNAYIAGEPFNNPNASIGTATVTGNGSRWDISEDLSIGNEGGSGES